MPHVVTENCINCRHTHCAVVCPVGGFHEGPNFLVIDPRECLDCGLCARECPVNAILKVRDVPKDQRAFIRLNAELAVIWPKITAKKVPPPDREEWDGVPDKLRVLER